eukprot:scaffold243342_cov23-Prasinocladus_malaysianus.AAC.1
MAVYAPMIIVIVITVAAFARKTTGGRLGPCPNPAPICARLKARCTAGSNGVTCSGRGHCATGGTCACFPGYAGIDCGEKECSLDTHCHENVSAYTLPMQHL